MANSDGLIKLDFDLSQIKDGFTIAVQRELPFAIAQALTQIGRVAQKGVRADLSSHFELRNKYVSSSIRIDPERVPKGGTEISVGAANMTAKSAGNDLMEKEAIGGEGRAKKGGEIMVPTGALRGSGGRLGKGELIPRNQRPKGLLANGAFFATMPKGGDGLYQRDSAGKIHKLYTPAKTVTLKAIWPLEATAGASVAGVYQELFVKALDRALKPRK